jgi:manganese efflux pump family protein
MTMLPLAVATSIDALAVGVSFAFLKVNIVEASSIIAVNHLPLVGNRRPGGLFFWHPIQIQGRIGRGVWCLIAIGTKILYRTSCWVRYRNKSSPDPIQPFTESKFNVVEL